MRKIIDTNKFLEETNHHLTEIIKSFENIPTLQSSSFSPQDTVIVNVDIINGFCREGILSSSKVAEIIPEAVRINKLFEGFKKIFFVDWHNEASQEFNSFPPHCMCNSTEAELVDELKAILDSNSTICHKNSTNGFVSPEYTKWLNENKNIKNIIVLGDVTDICVETFAICQKTFFNEINIASRIIIPVSAVETYDLAEANHYGDLMNIMSLYKLRMNGIEIVENII